MCFIWTELILKGHFGATHLYTSTEANEERAEKNSNEISRGKYNYILQCISVRYFYL